MKKAVILSLDDLRHITMIKLYTDYFNENGISYDIICFNRYHENNIKYGNADVYSYEGTDVKDNKIKKLLSYIKYRKFAISIMKKNNYDYIIVWGERTAAVFSDFIKKHKPYCINIRDIGFPKIPSFYKRLKSAVDNSDFSTWCAPNGIEMLPPHEYIIVMNQNKNLVTGAKVNDSFVEKGTPIRIGTVGYIRHIEPSKSLMRSLCNDERYIVQFFGTGAEQLADYAKEIGMKNIELKGTFKMEETSGLLDKTDVVNAYCGDGVEDVTISIGAPIRYGYSTLLYKPAIVSPHTYISEKTGQLNIGFTVDLLATFPDDFYNWYHSLNFDEFKRSCDLFNTDYDNSVERLHKICDEKIKMVILRDTI